MTLSFRELRNQLQPGWGFQHVGDGPDVDLLVVPSLSMDRHLIELVTGAHHYEERQLFESMLGMLSPRRVFTAKFDRTPKSWMKHCITSPNPAVSGITATRGCSLAAHPQVKSCTSCGRCVCCSMHGSRSSIFARLH